MRHARQKWVGAHREPLRKLVGLVPQDWRARPAGPLTRRDVPLGRSLIKQRKQVGRGYRGLRLNTEGDGR